MSAGFLGDTLVVWFERSVWLLKYTGAADLPFVWEKVVAPEGCYAPFSMVAFSDRLIALGRTKFLETDGLDVTEISDKTPDLALKEIAQNQYVHVVGTVLEQEDEVWFAHPAPGETGNTAVLCLNYKDEAWYQYDFGLQVFGTWSGQVDLTWDTVDATWDSLETTWDDRERQAGYPLTLGGDEHGYIYILNRGGDDNGADIEFELISGEWNPFWKDGRKTRLGWIDFLVTSDETITLNVEFYVDRNPLSYLTATLDFSGEHSRTKIWKRVFCGAIGESHHIRLSHTESNQTLEIHAIVPYFQQEGRIV